MFGFPPADPYGAFHQSESVPVYGFIWFGPITNKFLNMGWVETDMTDYWYADQALLMEGNT